MNYTFLPRLVPRKQNLYAAITVALILFFVGNVATIVAMTISGIYPGSAWLTLPNNSGANFFMHNSGNGNALEFVAQENGVNHWQVMNIQKNGNISMGHSNDPVMLRINGGDDRYVGGNTNVTVQTPLTLSNAAGRAMQFGRKAGTSGSDPWIISTNDYFLFTVDDIKSFSINKTGVHATKVTVSNSWADYVFEDDYNLMPLEEVESFIKDNKHLPNIPSQDEIESKGLNLGDMQRLQMEKIEELTLHLIDLKKENAELKQRISIIENNTI